MRKQLIFDLAVLAFLLNGAGPAMAGVIQISSAASLNPSDTTLTYPGNVGDQLASGLAIVAGGNTVGFFRADGGLFERVDQGNGWNGLFTAGTMLLTPIDRRSGATSPITITFASPVTEIGLQVEAERPVPTLFSVTAYNGSTPELTLSLTSPTNGFLGFVGVLANGGDTITSLAISSTDPDPQNSFYDNYFAISPVTFGFTATPVPSTLVMSALLIGMFGVVWYTSGKGGGPEDG